jgi:pectin methylesterase-like acyl-CoA thioesterase
MHGSSTHTSISAAVAAASPCSAIIFRIHVKSDHYLENILVQEDKINFVMSRDDKDITYVHGKRSVP